MGALLEVDGLRISARKDDDSLMPIVKGVSFKVDRGEVIALIGESGSGKTTIALSALGYTKPGLEFTGGEVRLEGEDVITMAPDKQRALRGQRVAYLAQSAAATFNPALTIGEQGRQMNGRNCSIRLWSCQIPSDLADGTHTRCPADSCSG